MAAYDMPKIGDVLADKYRLEKVAGEGGMGIVYAAEHLVLKQRVAVKVLLPDAATSEAVVERFAREARAAARIISEHVVRVMDAGSLDSGAPFLVMEYLEGCNLQELLELQRTLPVGEVVDYALQALEAIAHAHAVGIVHRDLKPANLFLACRPDGSSSIKILDFGISKAMKSKPEDKVLTGQAVLGSPVYMSPEQLRNAKQIDGRADIWSLGVVVYELLLGRPPFDGDGVGEIFAAILELESTPLHVADPRIPAPLSDVIAKALQRNPDDRYADAAEFARALAPFGSGTTATLVERAAQVLERARHLKGPATPPDARRVVDAIAAAAEFAARSFPPPPAVPKLAVPAKALPAPRRRLAALALGAAVLATGVVGGSALLAARASSPTGVATPVIAANVAAPRPAESPTPNGSSSANADDPPIVMDLPPDPEEPKRSYSGTRPTKPGKPQRPKFLNSRE